MDGPISIDITQVFTILLVLIGVSLVLALLLVVWIIWRVKRINLPPGVDALTTLRLTPLIVVVVLDLLDFSLDFLSAPFSWALLSYLGLNSLRTVTVIESVIPGTQFLPTMTAAWFYARLTDPGRRKHPTKPLR